MWHELFTLLTRAVYHRKNAVSWLWKNQGNKKHEKNSLYQEIFGPTKFHKELDEEKYEVVAITNTSPAKISTPSIKSEVNPETNTSI